MKPHYTSKIWTNRHGFVVSTHAFECHHLPHIFKKNECISNIWQIWRKFKVCMNEKLNNFIMQKWNDIFYKKNIFIMMNLTLGYGSGAMWCIELTFQNDGVHLISGRGPLPWQPCMRSKLLNLYIYDKIMDPFIKIKKLLDFTYLIFTYLVYLIVVYFFDIA
jgi:hypothetical protein